MKKIIVCVMMLVATGTITSVNAQDNKKDQKCTKTEQCEKKCKEECGKADCKGCKAEKCSCKKDKKEATPKKM